jgi:hypothetical protein
MPNLGYPLTRGSDGHQNPDDLWAFLVYALQD